MRVVAWNIRAGGGRRVPGIVAQIARWNADVVALSEARGTAPGLALREALADAGLAWQQTTVSNDAPRLNALLVASRFPIEPLTGMTAPDCPGRWLAVRVASAVPFMLGAMHVPNRVTGRKYGCLDGILSFARGWTGGPALIAGDTNTGRIDADEERPAFNAREDGWMAAMESSGWCDVYRRLHGNRRTWSWHSPQAGNGFRLDEAFANADLFPRIQTMKYCWGTAPGDGRRHALSDHAAMLIDIDKAPA